MWTGLETWVLDNTSGRGDLLLGSFWVNLRILSIVALSKTVSWHPELKTGCVLSRRRISTNLTDTNYLLWSTFAVKNWQKAVNTARQSSRLLPDSSGAAKPVCRPADRCFRRPMGRRNSQSSFLTVIKQSSSFTHDRRQVAARPFGISARRHIALATQRALEIISELRNPLQYHAPYTRTKIYQFSLNYALAHYHILVQCSSLHIDIMLYICVINDNDK